MSNKSFVKLAIALGLGVQASVGLADPTNLSEAFKACLHQSGGNNLSLIQEIPVIASSGHVLGITCRGQAAQDLYQNLDILDRNDRGKAVELSDGRTATKRCFGRTHSGVPSACYRVYQDHRGLQLNQYWCNIVLDITDQLVGLVYNVSQTDEMQNLNTGNTGSDSPAPSTAGENK